MYHYVYRITNKAINKHYYGVRTSKTHPKDDLGHKYFSSSSDKEFIKEQKNNPDIFKYKVIKICETRDESLDIEVKLHNRFNVDVNESFYNRAKQTSSKFYYDGTGEKNPNYGNPRNYKPTPEIVKQIADKNRGKVRSDDVRKKLSDSLQGHYVSDETRRKISESRKGKEGWNKGKIGVYNDDTINSIKTKVNAYYDSLTSEQKREMYGSHNKIQIVCPHCGISTNKGNAKRWHFDKCKKVK